MVIRTPSLNALKKGFLSQLHQPLPLSRRESQQLLESITASFRKNLDKEHPWQPDEATSQASTTATKAGQGTVLTTKHSNHSKGHRPTDRHLRAILSNPLFAPQHKEKATLPSSTSNPFDVFDYALSKGLMTPRSAAGFLSALRSRIVVESPDDVRQGMAKSGAALRVVQWLRASGQENSLQFLSDTVLIKKLVPFMYAEGLEEVAWTWLTRLAARSGSLEFEKSPGKPNVQSLSHLLLAMVRESSESSGRLKTCLDGSYEAMIRANQMLSSLDPAARASLRAAWWNISWASTVENWERPKPSAPLFDSFVDIGRPFKLLIDMAHLRLHHPLTPSHTAALKYMHTKADSTDTAHGTKMNLQTQRRMIYLALDTAERLKLVGNADEASWVERFLTNMCKGLDFSLFNPPNVGDSLASELPLYRMS
ncbi:hypothetical protein F5B20DRAFT_476347 [Whalleya microplaca]|nr:hypothetical protein F5B20DRAFT_476347 [Whalleya microplaca]